jgi:excisionase family DNA binding protein
VDGMDRTLTMTEAAELLGVHRSTVWREWRAWGLPFWRPSPTTRRWCIRESAVSAYIAQREAEQVLASCRRQTEPQPSARPRWRRPNAS